MNEFKCPNCAGALQISADGTRKICPYCDAEFILPSNPDVQVVVEHEQEINVKQQLVSPVEIVKSICVNSGFDSIYGAVGPSLIGTSKFNQAKKNFGIANGEDAYLIFDATVFGGYKKGFAVCTTGFYYSADGSHAFIISWDKFKSVNIVQKRSFLEIGGAEFNAGNDSKKLFEILTALKSSL